MDREEKSHGEVLRSPSADMRGTRWQTWLCTKLLLCMFIVPIAKSGAPGVGLCALGSPIL